MLEEQLGRLGDSAWRRELCQCGLGDRHYRYIRDDGVMVSLDHGESGDRPTGFLFVSGPTVDCGFSWRGYYGSAIIEADRRWPLE